MNNDRFAYASAKENAHKIFKDIGVAKYPQVVADKPSRPPLGGFNLGVSAYSKHPELAFDAAACMNSAENQLTATKLDGLPPTRQNLYRDKVVQGAYPGFADVIERSIEDAAARPLTPAYTDLSLAIQRALHPPEDIDPDDPSSAYDELKSKAEDAVKREGLL
jgi:multiple sugar transport system substrate-binding protein